MFLVLLCFGYVPLIVMGAAGLVANREAAEARMRNVLEAMVKNRKVTVELFLETTRRQLELVSASCSVEQLSSPMFLENLLDQVRHDRGPIVDLGLIGDTGRHLAYAGPYKVEGLDYHAQEWFQEVLVLGRYESDIFLGLRRFPHMVVAVKKREAGRDWILRATIDTDILSGLVREGGLESGADVFVLNRAGEYQTKYSDSHRLMEKAECGPQPLHSGVRVTDGRQGRQRQFIATTWLRGDSWVLVAVQRAPGLAALLGGQSSVAALLAVGLVLVPVLSHVIARHRLRQIRGLERERAALYESVAQDQKMAAIGRLAAGIAHEINNPLAIIQAQAGVMADMLADDSAPTPAGEFRGRIAKIEAQVERGRKVTHRLLGFSRRVGQESEPVDVAAAIDETLSFVEKELESLQVRIVRDYAADVPIVRSNLSQMQQVFLNLVNNALDAVGGGGEVRIAVSNKDRGVEVSIADNGPGIPPADLARVFEPFYSTKGGASQHSGLGLAICQEIMRSLGGRIAVESNVGVGTTFTLWFPTGHERGDAGGGARS
jgi:two-component system NtrC family sensor kinase